MSVLKYIFWNKCVLFCIETVAQAGTPLEIQAYASIYIIDIQLNVLLTHCLSAKFSPVFYFI